MSSTILPLRTCTDNQLIMDPKQIGMNMLQLAIFGKHIVVVITLINSSLQCSPWSQDRLQYVEQYR